MGPVTLIENRTGVVVCPVLASPAPQITWRKNGQIVYKGKDDPRNDKRLKVADNGRDLLIPNVQVTDAGEFTCQAVNRNGKAEDFSVVTVGSKYFSKNTRCATRIHNKVSETFSDRKFCLKHKLSTASLQSSTGKVIINYSTDIATGQWFTITTIMTCNITM